MQDDAPSPDQFAIDAPSSDWVERMKPLSGKRRLSNDSRESFASDQHRQHLRYFAHTQQFTKDSISSSDTSIGLESFCDENKWHFYSGAALFLETEGRWLEKSICPKRTPATPFRTLPMR